MDFKDYIQKTRTLIKTRRQDLSNSPEAEPIVDYNCPYEQTPEKPAKIGVLLVHGLLDSCFATRDIGDVLHKQGCLVRSILLPGHGTRPADLIKAKYEDWLEAIKLGVQSLKGEVDKIIIAGYSTGASLALLYAHLYQDIDGLMCFAAACKITERLAFLTGFVGWFGRFIPRLQYLKQFPENDCVKYRSMALNAAWQVYRLTKKIKNIRLDIPLYFAMSAQDEVVHFEETLAFFQKQSNPKNRFHVFSNDNRNFKDARIQTSYAALPEEKIVALSHPCLAYKPENPHYGKNGAFTKQAIKEIQPDCFGNVYAPKTLPDGRLMARLQYHPLFDEMAQSMMEYIRASYFA